MVIDVNQKELECSLHSQKNPHFTYKCCPQYQSRLDSSLPNNVHLQHVHNCKPAYSPNLNAPNHPKHAKNINTHHTKDTKQQNLS